MEILVDRGVLIRLTIPSDPAYPEARNAIRLLIAHGDALVSMIQNAAEFWNVCTRPASARGGYGLSIQETARKLRLVERLVEIRPDSQAAFQEWKRIVVAEGVKGVQVHDARLVAAMGAYGMTHLLTFNGDDFKRYGKTITVIVPKDVK